MEYSEGNYGRMLARTIAAFCRRNIADLRAGKSFEELVKKEIEVNK